jgi:hypothetical protein
MRGQPKNFKPKKDLRLPFSLVRFFWASKRTDEAKRGARRSQMNNVINESPPHMQQQQLPL